MVNENVWHMNTVAGSLMAADEDALDEELALLDELDADNDGYDISELEEDFDMPENEDGDEDLTQWGKLNCSECGAEVDLSESTVCTNCGTRVE